MLKLELLHGCLSMPVSIKNPSILTLICKYLSIHRDVQLIFTYIVG